MIRRTIEQLCSYDLGYFSSALTYHIHVVSTRYEDMMTPFEKLLSLPRPSRYLKPGNTLKKLNAFACAMTDNEAAEQMNTVRDKLFKQLHERLQLKA